MTNPEGTAEQGRPAGRRRPGRLRRWVVRPLLWTLALCCVVLFLAQIWINSDSGREWARRLLESQLQSRLDHPVSVGRVSFELLPFSLEAWDVRIAGGPAEQATDPAVSGTSGDAFQGDAVQGDAVHEPFLVLPRAVVDLDLLTLRRGRAEIQRLRVDRPEIHLEWYEPGGDNLVNRNPDRQRSDEPWEIWIDRVEIEQARVFLDHDRVDISVAADAVRTRLHGRGPLLLTGQTVAQDVEVRLPNAAPIRVSVAAAGSIQQGRLNVESARIRKPGLAADASGFCVFERATWDERKCTWNVRGEADGTVLDELGYFSDLRGPFEAVGELIWRPVATGWRSTVSARELRLWDRNLTDVTGVLVADRFAARLDLEHAGYAGGMLQGDVEVEVETPGRPLSVALTFEDQRFDDLLADQKIPVDGVASRLSGRLRYRCELRPSKPHPAGDLCRRGDGRGELFVSPDPDHDGLPLEGAFPVRIEEGFVRTDSLTLANATQSALAAGWYDLSADLGSWNYDIETADVGALLALLPFDDPADSPSWLPTDGVGRIGGHLELAPDGPRTELTLRLEDVVTPRLSTDSALGSLTADTEGLWDLRLDLGNGLHALHVEGDVPFGEAPMAPSEAAAGTREAEPLRLAFDAFRWPMDEVKPWLEDLPPLPLDGDVSGRLELTLPVAAPSSGSLAATLEPARIDVAGRSVPFDALATRLSWQEGRLDVQSLDLRSESGVISGAGRLDLPADDPPNGPGKLDLRLSSARLDLQAPPLDAYRPRGDLGGELALQAHLGGSFERPELELHLTSELLRVADRDLPGSSQLDVVWDGAQLGGALRVADALVIEGGGDLDLDQANLGFTLRADHLASLLALGTPQAAQESERDEGLDGRVAGEIRVVGALPAPEVRVLLDPLELRFRSKLSATAGDAEPGARPEAGPESETFELKTRRPIVLVCCTGRPGELQPSGEAILWVESAALVDDATASRIELDGAVHDAFGTPRAELGFQADLDAAWVRLLALPDLPVSGRIEVAGRLTGDPSAPDLLGSATLREGVFDVPGMPQAVTNLTGRVQADGRSLRFEEVRGRFAGGRVHLGGYMRLAEAEDDPSSTYRLTLDARDVDLRHPDGWSLAGDAELVMTSTAGGATVGGRADLRRLGWHQDLRFELSEMMRELFRQRRLEVSAADATLSAIALNVQLVAPDAVRVDNNLATMTGSADLFLRGNLATPVLYGEVTIDEGGTLVYNGVDYVVDRGRILFVDPYDLKAEVDLTATTRVRDFDVTLSAFGSLERLDTRFASDPPLPDVELFRLLAGGDVVEAESQLLDPRIARLADDESTSAAGFLYGQAAAAIGDRVSGLFGLDKFRIDPLTGSDRDNLSKARITVGKRLSKDVFITYSVDPSSNDNQRLQIEWRVAEGLTLVLTQNGDNSYSADARWDSTF